MAKYVFTPVQEAAICPRCLRLTTMKLNFLGSRSNLERRILFLSGQLEHFEMCLFELEQVVPISEASSGHYIAVLIAAEEVVPRVQQDLN
jgi:hypothetical protein